MRRLQRAVDVSKGGEAWFVAGAAGASLASLEARVGNARRAVELYEWLLPLWARTGDTSVVWTAMRSISALLFQLDQPDSAATLLEAVRTTSDGHRVFGIDIDRLDNLERALREQIGTERFEAAACKGRGLDAAAVTDLAMQQLAVRRYYATSSAGPGGIDASGGDQTVSWVRASLAGWKPPQRTSRTAAPARST